MVGVTALSSGERPRAGEPSESSSCDVITSVPEAMRSRHVMRPFGISRDFYHKFTEAYGIPVVGESPPASTRVEINTLTPTVAIWVQI